MNELMQVNNLYTYLFDGARYIVPVRGVSFAIYENETVGLVGESGCGKSILSHSLLRLFHKNEAVHLSGSVQFLGENIIDMEEKKLQSLRKHDLSIVFQDAQKSLNPLRPIGKQLIDTLRNASTYTFFEARKRAGELLADCGILDADERLRAYPHELSGGMQQRVMIAMALAKNPRLLIADEPTTALDVTTQKQILLLFRALQQKFRTSILLVTHDLSILEEICDRVMVMYRGELVEIAPTFELLSNPKHPYTKKLIASSLRLDSERGTKIVSIPGNVEKLTEPVLGCPFSKRCDHAFSLCKEQHPYLIQSAGHYVRCFLEGANYDTK